MKVKNNWYRKLQTTGPPPPPQPPGPPAPPQPPWESIIAS
jgi:hypothetical protein